MGLSGPARLRRALGRLRPGSEEEPARETSGEVSPDDVALVLRAGVVDPGWVAHQTGLDVADDPEAAVVACLGRPRCSPHPLFHAPWVRNGPGPTPPPDQHPLVWWLTHPTVQDRCSPHPVVDPARVVAGHPAPDGSQAGPVAAWLAALQPADLVPTPAGLTDTSYDALRRASLAAVAGEPARPGPLVDLPPGSTSVVACVRGGGLPALVEDVLALALDPATELVAVASDLVPWQRATLAALDLVAPGLRLVPAPDGAGVGACLDLGLGASRADVVVLGAGAGLADAEVTRSLREALADGGVACAQPVVVHRDGTVAAAGAVFAGPRPHPVPFLAGHAEADLDGLGDRPREVPAAWGPLLAVRRAEVAGVDDPALADEVVLTGLAAVLARDGRRVVLVPERVQGWRPTVLPDDASLEALYRHLDEVLTVAPTGSTDLQRALWRDVGLDVVGTTSRALRDEPAHEVPLGTLRVVHPVLRAPRAERVTEAPPRLRWAIDTPVPGGPTGQQWGDLHFAESLATALRGLGQHVAVDRRNARHRWSRDLDDVLLVIRGKHRVVPWPTTVNLAWVISHPDEVTAAEAASYDRVFAAGPAWAADVSRRWGLRVDPLLQATDADRFRPDPAAFDTGEPVLFVGNSRLVFRDSLRLALEAGLDVAVYGDHWDGLLPPGTVRATYLPNHEVGAAYAAAGLVLNDHWEAMRDAGFVSNRLMDAAASGARVATDEVAVDDLEGLFGGLVRTFATAQDLRALATDPGAHFPTGEARVAAAERVRREHSFAARAQVLLEAAAHEHARRA